MSSVLPESHLMSKLGGQVASAQLVDAPIFGTTVQSDPNLGASRGMNRAFSRLREGPPIPGVAAGFGVFGERTAPADDAGPLRPAPPPLRPPLVC